MDFFSVLETKNLVTKNEFLIEFKTSALFVVSHNKSDKRISAVLLSFLNFKVSFFNFKVTKTEVSFLHPKGHYLVGFPSEI